MIENRMNRNTHKTIRCALCGKEIHTHISKDHCHPRAIYKWLEHVLEEPEFVRLKKLVSGRDNMICTHDECNYAKEDFTIDVEALYLPYSKKEKIREVHQKILPYSQRYNAMKSRVRDRQAHKCFRCGCDLSENGGVMRRIDPSGARTEENACLVCHGCNVGCEGFEDVTGAAV